MKKNLSFLLNPFSKFNLKACIVVVLVFVTWFFLPKILLIFYSDKIKGDYFSLYYDNNYSKDKMLSLIQEVDSKLSYSTNRKELYCKVLFVDNEILFNIITPFNIGGLGTNNTKLNIVVVNLSKFKKNLVYVKKYPNGFPLSNLVTHEVTHSIIKKNIPQKLPLWLSEGYSEHIAFIDRTTKEITQYYSESQGYLEYLKRYRTEVNKTRINDLKKFVEQVQEK